MNAWAEARALIVVVILLGFAGAAAWRLRSRGPGAAARIPRWLQRLAPPRTDVPARVIQSTRLTPRASLHVVRWDDREWLVGCTDQAVTVLGQRAVPASEGGGAGAQSSRSDSGGGGAP